MKWKLMSFNSCFIQCTFGKEHLLMLKTNSSVGAEQDNRLSMRLAKDAEKTINGINVKLNHG
jgi:hypothetical protein